MDGCDPKDIADGDNTGFFFVCMCVCVRERERERKTLSRGYRCGIELLKENVTFLHFDCMTWEIEEPVVLETAMKHSTLRTET
jgi:hypothetical protein